MLQDPIRTPIAISLGAIAGALSRYYLTLWFAKTFGTSFPYGTLVSLSGLMIIVAFQSQTYSVEAFHFLS